MSDLPKFAQRHLIENQRIAEIKKLAEWQLENEYEDQYGMQLKMIIIVHI